MLHLRKLPYQVLKRSPLGTMRITIMTVMIIGASQTYIGLLAFTGATRELVNLINSLQVSPLVTLMMIMFILLLLGTFMDRISTMMITVPIYIPIITALGYNPIWFAILMLLNLEMAMSAPPFGLFLFVMKVVAPPGTTIADIIRGAVPILLCDLIVMIMLIMFPSIILFWPSFM